DDEPEGERLALEPDPATKPVDRVGTWPLRRIDVQHASPGDRRASSRVAKDERVAHRHDQRAPKRDPHERLAAGRHLAAPVEADARVALGRAGVELEGASR